MLKQYNKQCPKLMLKLCQNFYILGGIKAFASNDANVLKWCVNRPYQAKYFKELTNYAGTDPSTLCYKPLRISEIEKTERNVRKIIDVLENEYINPFSLYLDIGQLHNLSSGDPKESGVEEVLLIEESESIAATEFLEKPILTSEVNFHDPIQRVKVPTFQKTSVKLKKNGSEKIVYTNRDIISRLISLSTRFEKSIDFRYALTYPSYPFPLSMAFPDSSKRDPLKSMLLHEILPNIPDKSLTELVVDKTRCAYVIDMIAQIRCCIVSAPQTFQDLATKFLQPLREGYGRYDIVTDTYRESSIKSQREESVEFQQKC